MWNVTEVCFENTEAAGHRSCYDNTSGNWKASGSLLSMVLWKNISLIFYTHPVLGGSQNKFTIGSSSLSLCEGLASETTASMQGGGQTFMLHSREVQQCR